MKKIVFTTLLILGLALPAQAASLLFSSTTTDIFVGDTLSIDINIADLAGIPLAGYDFGISYDETIFTFTGYSFSDALGILDIDAFDASPVSTPGTANVALGSLLDGIDLLPLQQDDPLALVTLTFEAAAAGQSAFGFSWVEMTDADYNSIAADISDILTASATPVPAPSAVSMFALGLLSLAGITRRR